MEAIAYFCVMHRLLLLAWLFVTASTLYAKVWTLPDSVTVVQFSEGKPRWVRTQFMAPIHAGDTVLLLTGCHKPIKFKGIVGSTQQPVYLLAQSMAYICGDTSSAYGISFEGCRYIFFNGYQENAWEAPEMLPAIIDIGKGPGLSIDQFSSDIEIAWLTISQVKTAGMLIKTDPACNNLERYKTFVMHNIHIHHCGIKHTGTEGMYVGYSGYNEGKGKYLHCGKDSVQVFPHPIEGINIHDNTVEYTGWDGIQVASGKDVRIHHNMILNASAAQTPHQMSGILIGEPCQARVYSNIVMHDAGPGIVSLGQSVRIYNNLIHFPLLSSEKNPGIYISDKVLYRSSLQADTMLVAFNTMIAATAADSLYFIKTNIQFNQDKLFLSANLFVFDPERTLEHEYRLNQKEVYTKHASASAVMREQMQAIFPELGLDLRDEARLFSMPVAAGCFR